jgi:hypothetical protein
MSSSAPRSPYAAPGSRSFDPIGALAPVYTPTQIALGTFVGGVVGFVYFLRANFVALGKPDAARNTVLGGAALFVVVLGLALALPQGGGSIGITIAMMGLARWIAERYQMSKDAIAASADHEFHSSWRVFGIALACLALNVVIVVGTIMAITLLTTS